VAEGMRAYDQGRYDEALSQFEEARKTLPKSAAVEFDRGNALFKLGRLEDAKQAYDSAAQLDQGELRAKDYYNQGDAWAQLGHEKEAIAAFRKALTLDPNDEQARHNLEVMLRKLPPQKPQAQDGGADGGPRGDSGHPDGGGRDGGADGGRQDGGADGGRDGGADAGPASDGGTDGGGDGGQGDGGNGAGQSQRSDGGQSKPSPERADGGVDAGGGDAGEDEDPRRAAVDAGTAELGRLSKDEAERLLDSMKRDEKNLQLWRFQQRKPKKTTEKDW
jgi:tetratricopeptide (TPR) repeat protein